VPTFSKLSREEVAARQPRPKGSLDLTTYLEFVRELNPGEGGELILQEGESPRTIKRRLSMAATRLKRNIRWRHSQDGVLRFEVR